MVFNFSEIRFILKLNEQSKVAATAFNPLSLYSAIQRPVKQNFGMKSVVTCNVALWPSICLLCFNTQFSKISTCLNSSADDGEEDDLKASLANSGLIPTLRPYQVL